MPVLSYGRASAWHADRDPEGVAIVHEGQERRRGELERRSNRLARAYQALGVGDGDRVTLALANGIEFYEACLAIWKLGATPQPISYRLPEVERRAIVDLAKPSLVVGADAGEYGFPSLASGFEPDLELSDAPLPDRVPSCARAMTSGGSTGRPKLIVDRTPGQVDPEIAPNDMRVAGTTLVPGPLYHAGPFITSWQQLFCGGRVIVMSRFDAAGALELIERHRVDWVLFVPTMMQRIWRLPVGERARFDLSSLRIVMSSGAASPVWLKRAWIEWLGPERIFEAYGGSERIAGTRISGSEWLAHPGSVGKPAGGGRMKVLAEDGRELPPGEVGEVYMMAAAGQGSTYAYVGDRATATSDGWETLGDLGYMDEAGYLYLVDRRTDMIVSGGANVYPAEIEAALDAHPAVRSSAVIGLPDDDLGQRVHAIYESTEPISDEELRDFLKRQLVVYKVPRTFEHVKEPLRDDAGKVRRPALREARLPRAPELARGSSTP
jgi:bile acid-coenzyme A ligase